MRASLMCALWNLYIHTKDKQVLLFFVVRSVWHWLRHEKLSVFSRKQSFLSCLYSLRDCGLLLGCRANPFNARKLLAMPIGRIGKKMISGFILISPKISAKKSRLQIRDLDATGSFSFSLRPSCFVTITFGHHYMYLYTAGSHNQKNLVSCRLTM